MLKKIIIGAFIAATSAAAVPAYACGMHGFGNFQNSNWKTYTPRVSTQDPALMIDDGYITPAPVQKMRPSFSNAANRASIIAKSRIARKAKAEKRKDAQDAAVTKAASNTDR